MSAKEKIYDQYRSTHVKYGKTPPSLELFSRACRSYAFKYREFLPPDHEAAFLDAGCGDGRFVYWLHAAGYHRAEGFDISSEQVEIAARLGVRNVFKADLFEFFAVSEKRYDVIFLRDVLEHFSKEDVLRILRGAHGRLTDGGKVVIHVPNGVSPFHGRILFGDFTHETAFTIGSLSMALNTTGFVNHSFKPDDFQVRSLTTLVRFCGWKLTVAVMKAVLFFETGRSIAPTILTQNLIASAEKPAAKRA